MLPKISSLVIFEVRYSKLNKFYTYLCHDVRSWMFCFVFFFHFVSSSKGFCISFYVQTTTSTNSRVGFKFFFFFFFTLYPTIYVRFTIFFEKKSKFFVLSSLEIDVCIIII